MKMATFGKIFVRHYNSNLLCHQGTSHTEKLMHLWRNISMLIGVPAIILAMANCYMLHQEHAHEERPEFIPYAHLRHRSKKFPWRDGVKSLFHNPHANPLPDGYHDD